MPEELTEEHIERAEQLAATRRDEQKQAKKPAEQILTGGSISNGTAALWIGIALAVDIVQFLITFIPVIGWIINMIISAFMWLSVYIWIKSKTAAAANLKRNPIFILLTGGILEEIPIFDALPIWTGTVIALVLNDRVPSPKIPGADNKK